MITSSKIQKNILKTNLAPYLRTFYGEKFSVFSVEGFYFSKYHGNKAKHDKHNFKIGLTVTFEVKNL